ncbi:MFS general substrate transporter [Glonium stellatum]|uniref:MFS general substrate transporter n=1 Tax=Glonium stellatum TaxID=574774 RepID=A0A8E2JMZ3_9PEZI|nr:MFS general substrate transporter [Glonium stellatum]
MTEEKPGASSSSSLFISPTKELDVEVDSSRPSTSSGSDTESIARNSITGPGQKYNRDDLEKVISGVSAITGISAGTTGTVDSAFEVDFEEGDGANPREWSMAYKGMIIGLMSFSTMTVVMYSTSYASGIPGMEKTFNIFNETIVVLGITTYLFGLAVGSIVLAPLSEMFGRRPIYLVTMALYSILIIPCALAKNLETILVTRFFGAVAGSAMLSNAPGTVSDIVNDEWRALAFSIWSLGPMNGPVIGPLIGGFVYEYLGWRWTNWIVMIASGISFCFMAIIRETYAPAILREKAINKRKDTGDPRWFSRYDDKKQFWPMLKENLRRPLSMALTEPICIFWNIYIAIIYAILYLCFVAYPIIFSDLRGWSAGITGLSYVGLGIGGLITIITEPLIRRMINSHKPDPATGKPPPESMILVVCIAAVSIPVGELIFAWTGTPNVHWSVPILAGIPFGAGNCAVFIYASNYLVHSYGIYAASALAGNAVLRSIMGGCLPLAGPAMYKKLGPHWAGTMLGLFELALVPIPVVFWRYGHRIRQKSALIRSMREDQEKLEGRKRRAAEREARARRRDEKLGNVEELEGVSEEAVEKKGKDKEVFEV